MVGESANHFRVLLALKATKQLILLKKFVKSGELQRMGMGCAAAYVSLKSEKTRKNAE